MEDTFSDIMHRWKIISKTVVVSVYCYLSGELFGIMGCLTKTSALFHETRQLHHLCEMSASDKVQPDHILSVLTIITKQTQNCHDSQLRER